MHIKYILPILLLILFNIFYQKSLSGCPFDPPDLQTCIKWFSATVVTLVKHCLYSVTAATTLTILVLYRLTHPCWLIPFTLNLLYFYVAYDGRSFDHHGFFNFWIFLALFILFLVLLAIGKWVLGICRSGWPGRIILGVSVAILFLSYFYMIEGSWDGWEYGIGGDKIDNDIETGNIGEAKVYIPHYWEMNIRRPLFNWSGWSKQCKDSPMLVEKKAWTEKLRSKKNIKRIGYPRPEHYPDIVKMNETFYLNRVNEDLIDMDDPDVPQHIKDNIEVTIDMSNDNGHTIQIDVKRNETRVQELKEIRKKVLEQDKAENNTDRIDHDVLILYLDHLSRPHFHSRMPKLSAWLGQFKNTERELSATEYFRFHSMAKTTYHNNNAFYMGEHEEKNHDETNFVFRYYSANGYVTGMFKEGCEMNAMRYIDVPNRPPLYSYDHYGSALFWDQNYDIGSNHNIVFSKGRNSHFRRCLYGRDVFDIQFEYIDKFWAAYPDVRKVFRTHLSYAHETTGEVIATADEGYADFLQSFYEKGYLNNTQVMIVADHGAHMVTLRTPFFPDDSRMIENALPILIHLTPKSINEKFLANLAENQQLFVSAHEIYATLKSLAVGKASSSALVTDYSYIHEKLPRGRDCTTPLCIAPCDFMLYENPWLYLNYEIIEEKVNEHGYFYFGFDF